MVGEIAPLGQELRAVTLNAHGLRQPGSRWRASRSQVDSKEAGAQGELGQAVSKCAPRSRRVPRVGRAVRRSRSSRPRPLARGAAGLRQRRGGSGPSRAMRPSMPFFERALELDPNFAMRPTRYVGTAYQNMRPDGPVPSSIGLEKAYELRDRVSEPERLYILAHYYDERSRRHGQGDRDLRALDTDLPEALDGVQQCCAQLLADSGTVRKVSSRPS